MNIAESRGESEIVAEPGLGVGIDAGVEIGFAFGKRLEHACQRIHAAGRDNSRDDRAKNPGRSAKGSRQRPGARPDHRTGHHHGLREQREFLRLLRGYSRRSRGT